MFLLKMCHGNKHLSPICTTDLGVWKYKYYKTIALWLYIAFDFVIMSGEALEFWGRNLKTLQSLEHVQFIIDKADKLECLDSNVHREKVEYSVMVLWCTPGFLEANEWVNTDIFQKEADWIIKQCWSVLTYQSFLSFNKNT